MKKTLRLLNVASVVCYLSFTLQLIMLYFVCRLIIPTCIKKWIENIFIFTLCWLSLSSCKNVNRAEHAPAPTASRQRFKEVVTPNPKLITVKSQEFGWIIYYFIPYTSPNLFGFALALPTFHQNTVYVLFYGLLSIGYRLWVFAFCIRRFGTV